MVNGVFRGLASDGRDHDAQIASGRKSDRQCVDSKVKIRISGFARTCSGIKKNATAA
ncbi:hypothetical protein [Paraburkholderia denitrificans]|uniref:hypothetical protein n=1 Tax=Paraburkholderia denitrificans TaxID=694025 RepID=UPI00366E028D